MVSIWGLLTLYASPSDFQLNRVGSLPMEDTRHELILGPISFLEIVTLGEWFLLVERSLEIKYGVGRGPGLTLNGESKDGHVDLWCGKKSFGE